MTTSTGRGKGFASMNSEQRQKIASMGGKAAWEQGVAYRWTSEQARAAGRKGGRVSRLRPKKPGTQP